MRKLRLAIEQGREELVVIKNYRKNGSSYWSRVQIAPIRDSNDRITLIVSVQYEVRKYHKYSINMKYQITHAVEYENNEKLFIDFNVIKIMLSSYYWANSTVLLTFILLFYYGRFLDL